MTEILAAFRSRAQAIDALAKLKSASVVASLVNTPREANIGCGLSIKFFESFLPRARVILARGGYSSFWGYLAAYNSDGRKFFRKI